MKDMVYERIIELSSAQESLIQAGDVMDKLYNSQHMIEKYSYEAMNMTDTVLNLAKQGKQLVDKLEEGEGAYSDNPSEEEKENIIRLLAELDHLLSKIIGAATSDNEILHSIENTAAEQNGLTEELKDTIGNVSSCIDHAVACAEMVMTKDVFE